MIFTETKLKGAFIIDIESIEDERGFFARSWCREEFEAQGLNPQLAQCNISFNKKKGTLRGMHYQKPPHEEVKLVRCTMGAIFDVIIDMRSDSHTYKQWVGETLAAKNRKMLYIPKGFAHGFVTLEDDTEVFYQMSTLFHPESVAGVRWDDPAFKIIWPKVKTYIISDKDRNYEYL